MKLLVRAAPSASDAAPGESFDDVLGGVDTGKGRYVGLLGCKPANRQPLWRLQTGVAQIVTVSAPVPLEAGNRGRSVGWLYTERDLAVLTFF